MRRSQAFALGAALAVLVSVAGEAFTAPTRTGQINVTATLAYSTARALGPAGRQSDAIEQSWRINDRAGTRIGRMLVQCRWIRPRARLCSGEIAMPLGKLTFLGSSLTPFEGEYAVTGGTGAYRSAGGVMLFTAIGLRKTVLLITVEE